MPSASSPPDTLSPGTVIAHRFTIQRLAGRGGMGFVFLARDSQTGNPVALKLLHAQDNPESARRFAREAQLLAALRHPGIVSYVDHGALEDGQPYLAMEWLEGEDLAQRLTHTPLSLSETLQLMRRAADALASAHAQGIVHRDLKPSNLFLRSGQPRDAVLLDFGLARFHATSQRLTGSATMLGTPGYMAPEQVTSFQSLSPAADIFSLGCVLYECLAGQPPFSASHMAAALAKILFSEPPPLRASRPELPASLQALVEQMMSKEPGRRPPDGAHLLRALETLEAPCELPPPPSQSAASRLPEAPSAEQHLVTVLLATPELPSHDQPTLEAGSPDPSRERLKPLLKELESHGATARRMADGSLLATFLLERGTATDQASLAAHCALLIQEQWPESHVALTTGLSLRGRPLPIGDALDRAGNLLHLQKDRNLRSAVLVDDTTAGLLASRFQLDKMDSGLFLLRGEHLSVDESRPLLGRPTPCVGREQELALLELSFTTCVEDASARAVLITAPAGTGKSRVRHELLRRLERQAHPPLVLLGRGDPMNTSAAHGLVGQAMRRLCGIVDGEPLEARRAKLVQRITRHLPPAQHQDATEFLGELCAIPFPGEESPRLRTAREDPHLMNAQVTRALVAWLEAECAQQPVLLMLEDLHWSDGPTINLIDEVLRELSNQPLLVLALARPEVKELFPGLWSRNVQEVPLRGLSQKAGMRLVQEVLGPQVPEAVVARLVGQAAGNALFLEELIRGVAEGRGQETPGSVLAMLQSRLQRLEPEARRVVLAASLFGRTFWAGGVRALLEPAMSPEALGRWLRLLVELELVQPQPSSRFPAESEFRFHHALVRDAAYSLVPDGLRATGHLQAGEWLEAAGESEPLVLAEHYKLGGQKQKAIHFFTRACKQISERQRTDLQGAQACLKAALACEPSGPELTELQVLEADFAFWLEDFSRTIAVSEELLPKLAEGSASWIQVVGNLIMMNAKSGRPEETGAWGHRLLGITPAPEAVGVYSEALAFLGTIYQWTGHRSAALTVLDRMAEVAQGGLERDRHIALGWWATLRGQFEHYFVANPRQGRKLAAESVASFDKVGAERSRVVSCTVLGQSMAALGELSRAAEVMREGLARAKYFAQAHNWLQLHMALELAHSPERAHQEEARDAALQTRKAQSNPMHLGLATVALARVALAQGVPAEAETWAREACTLLGGLILYELFARTCLSAALLAQGRAAEARVEAERGVPALEQIHGPALGLWLALAEACQAQGDDTAAERALRQSWECLRQKTMELPDAEARERLVSQVPENARVRRLARQRWGEQLEKELGL